MDETRTCPYCGEAIRAEATRCRYCRSRLTALNPERWHRDHPDRRVAGVAAAVARAFTIPVTVARLGFIVLAFFHFLGPILYGALWFVIPFAPSGASPFERGRAWVQDQCARLLSQCRAHSTTRDDTTGSAAPQDNDSSSAAGQSGLPAHPLP